MMRLHALLSSTLATLVVAPVLLDGTDELQTLKAALRSTSRALEVVGGIQRKVSEEPAEGAALVRRVTETPILDAHARDERLVELREQVNLLRTELDLLETAAMTRGARPLVPGATPSDPTTAPANPSGVPPESLPLSTGLDVNTRAALERMALGVRSGGANASAAPSAARGDETDGGYSADPVRQARACYRVGRFAEGAAVLAGVDGDPAALFWRARCSERAGDLDGAEKDLRSLLALAPEGDYSERARQDLEFLQWKRDFLARMPRTEGGKP